MTDDNLMQKIHELSNGTASIVTVKSGLSIYTPLYRNNAITSAKYGDKNVLSTEDYIKKSSIKRGRLSLTSLIRGFNIGNYTGVVELFLIGQYITNRAVTLLTMDTELYPSYFELTSLLYKNRDQLGIDGYLHYDEGSINISLYSTDYCTLTAIEQPTLDSYKLMYSINRSTVDQYDRSELDHHILSSESIVN